MKIRNIISASLAVLIMGAGGVSATNEKEQQCEKARKALINQHEMYKYYQAAMVKAKKALSLNKTHQTQSDYDSANRQFQNSQEAWTKNSSRFHADYHGNYDSPDVCSKYVKGASPMKPSYH